MDDLIGRLVANIGDDRAAACMAVGILAHSLRGDRCAGTAGAPAGHWPAAKAIARTTFHNSCALGGAYAAGEFVGAIPHRSQQI